MRTIQILDTTLRDGMQQVRVGVNKEGRKRIAQAIALTNPDVMEIGFAANNLDCQWMPYIADKILRTQGMTPYRSEISGLARLVQGDVDKTREVLANVPEEQRRIHLFVGASEILRKNGVRKSAEEILDMIGTYVSYAAGQGFATVQFSPEDAARDTSEAHYAFIKACVRTAYDAGATVINIPDTTGWCPPPVYGDLIARLRADLQDVSVWSTHTHRDGGQAEAVALEGVRNGATQVEGTVLGLGERAGNADWMIVAANLYVQSFYGAKTNVHMQRFKRTAKDVARHAGITFPRSHPVVGRNAHATSSGVHVRANLSNPASYHVLSPQTVGYEGRNVLGQTSGTSGVAAWCANRGVEVPSQLEKCTDAIKLHCAENGGHIPDDAVTQVVQQYA
jgi:2-isopropylmalate synthase